MIALAACGGGGPGDVGSIGGTVQGLTASGLRLRLELGSGGSEYAVDVPANADTFAFRQVVLQGTHYRVTVALQPAGLTCTVASGEGDMGSSPVRSVSVFCGTAIYLVGGTVSGLEAGDQLLLQLNGNAKPIAGNGPYTFDDRIPLGAGYVVSVKTPPAGKGCAVANASGVMGNADVAGVDVSCSPLVPARPALAVTAGIKQLRFSWGAASLATFYRLSEDPDGSGFVQRGGDLSGTAYDLDVSVHRHDWAQARYRVDACNALGCTPSDPIAADQMLATIGYFKASNADAGDQFGTTVALSADGNTLAVSAMGEDGAGTGVNGTQQMDNLASGSGAVYVLVRTDGAWTQQAYIKPTNTAAGDAFGTALALSADGRTLAVGAPAEDGNATGIGIAWGNDLAPDSGAVYVFVRNDTSWLQQAYVKASNTEAGDAFGSAVALSANGSTLAVGAPNEDGGATGVGGSQANSAAATDSGAVYLFTRNTAAAWSQQAYVKASNTDDLDHFGGSVALSGDGDTLAVGAKDEAARSACMGYGQSDNYAPGAGAVYVFTRSGTAWSQQAYVKDCYTETEDEFGGHVALSGDGNTLAVGAVGESSSATGVGGDGSIDALNHAGAVYLFARSGASWSRQAYIKASNTYAWDKFGAAVTLSQDGNTLAVGAPGEGSISQGVGGSQVHSTGEIGAAYVFTRGPSAWSQQAYVKASNTRAYGDEFGYAVGLSSDGSTLAVGAWMEDGASAGIGGAQTGYVESSGAVYLY